MDWRRHLGRKVSLRYRTRDPEHPWSEAVGVLQSVDRDESGRVRLSVVNRRGGRVAVDLDDVDAAKVFPV